MIDRAHYLAPHLPEKRMPDLAPGLAGLATIGAISMLVLAAASAEPVFMVIAAGAAFAAASAAIKTRIDRIPEERHSERRSIANR